MPREAGDKFARGDIPGALGNKQGGEVAVAPGEYPPHSRGHLEVVRRNRVEADNMDMASILPVGYTVA
jgi:hypothetical protein